MLTLITCEKKWPYLVCHVAMVALRKLVLAVLVLCAMFVSQEGFSAERQSIDISVLRKLLGDSALAEFQGLSSWHYKQWTKNDQQAFKKNALDLEIEAKSNSNLDAARRLNMLAVAKMLKNISPEDNNELDVDCNVVTPRVWAFDWVSEKPPSRRTYIADANNFAYNICESPAKSIAIDAPNPDIASQFLGPLPFFLLNEFLHPDATVTVIKPGSISFSKDNNARGLEVTFDPESFQINELRESSYGKIYKTVVRTSQGFLFQMYSHGDVAHPIQVIECIKKPSSGNDLHLIGGNFRFPAGYNVDSHIPKLTRKVFPSNTVIDKHLDEAMNFVD